MGTLSVPPALRARVGLVFYLDAQSRVEKRGVRGADPAVRFIACPADGEPGRTGAVSNITGQFNPGGKSAPTLPGLSGWWC